MFPNAQRSKYRELEVFPTVVYGCETRSPTLREEMNTGIWWDHLKESGR